MTGLTFLEKFVLIGSLNVHLNSTGQLVKLYRKSKRALEYAKKSGNKETAELARGMKEDIMTLFGSKKNLDRLLKLGSLKHDEYDEIKLYLEK